MAKNNIKLTAALINGYKAEHKGYRVFDATITGLTLYIGTSGTKSWSLNYSDRSGKRQSYRIGSTRAYSVVDARTAARKLLNDIATGSDPAQIKRDTIKHKKAAVSRTLTNYLDGEYWTHYLDKQRSGEKTRRRIKSGHLPFMDCDMAEITSTQLIRHRTERLNSGLQPQTLNRERVAIHALFVRAIGDKLISFNPANKNDFQPLEAIKSNRTRYLGQYDEREGNSDGVECARFMDALNSSPRQIQAIVGLALQTGCRRGELLSLRWADVSLRNRTLTVMAHNAKSNKERHIPLTALAVDILKGVQGNVLAIDKDALVFPNLITGERQVAIDYEWGKLVKRAGVLDFKLHDCRHDFASRLVMAGVELITVRDLLGHGSITMTERYSHLAPETLRSAIDKLGEL